MRRRLAALLAAHEQPDSLLTTQADPARPNHEIDLTEAPDEAVGQTLGRYKLLERVGEGGCGVVYVAEQTEPVRRRVALKVITLGMDTKQVVARFEAERQALAMMDHPNIAKVLDAGMTEGSHQSSVTSHQPPESGSRGAKHGPLTPDHRSLITSSGRPYFVMELVRGIKITDSCDQASLSTKERLDLFIKVCQAIQHAPQKGIIHRDIKPSNDWCGSTTPGARPPRPPHDNRSWPRSSDPQNPRAVQFRWSDDPKKQRSPQPKTCDQTDES